MSEIQYWKQDLGKHDGTFQKFVAELRHDKQKIARSYYTEGRRTTFTLTKCIEYSPEDLQEKLALKTKWLDRLHKDSFNRIHIPKFEYEILNSKLYITSEYIKGKYLNKSKMSIIEEDVVYRKNRWSFADYNYRNYIQEERTDNIYMIDFDTYREISIKDRKILWEKQRLDWKSYI
tara:strand:- start:5736 stop:6263 length:528 start_codon:yes stop_codon:yes gene_type:complete